GTSGQVKNTTASRGRLDETDLSVNEAVGYLAVNLIPDLLTFYLDERFAPSVDTREAWGMMYLPYDIYLKVGKMFLPYGLQLQDDNAFIRGGRNGSATAASAFSSASRHSSSVGSRAPSRSRPRCRKARSTTPTCKSPARSMPCSRRFPWCATCSSASADRTLAAAPRPRWSVSSPA